MDAKANAIKRMKLKAAGHQSDEVMPVKTKEKDDDDLGDAAPSLDAKKPGIADLGPEHMAVMQDLMGSVSHPGRKAMTLDEKAKDGMKEKMASIKSHKKSF